MHNIKSKYEILFYFLLNTLGASKHDFIYTYINIYMKFIAIAGDKFWRKQL